MMHYSSMVPHLTIHTDLDGPKVSFFVHWMDKIEKSSKILSNCLADFLPFMYQKVKNYFWLSKRHPLATIDVMQLNIPALKS